jgi:hypothetical protein
VVINAATNSRPRRSHGQERDRAHLPPVGGVGLPDQVRGQIAKVEAVDHGTGVSAGNVKAGRVLMGGNPLDQADTVDVGQPLAFGAWVLCPTGLTSNRMRRIDSELISAGIW